MWDGHFRIAARQRKGWVLAMLGRDRPLRDYAWLRSLARAPRAMRTRGVRRSGGGWSTQNFPASQIDAIPDYVPAGSTEPRWQGPHAVRKIIAASETEVRSGVDRACYVPCQGYVICLPPTHAFKSADLRAEIAPHELAHARGSVTPPSQAVDRSPRRRSIGASGDSGVRPPFPVGRPLK